MTHLHASDALRAVLLALPARVAIERLDRLWIFPPRDLAGKESGLIVLALLPPEEAVPPARQLITVHYEAGRASPRDFPGIVVTEEGWVPADRMARVIGGVVSRLGDQDDPVEHAVAGSPDGWTSLLGQYGMGGVDPGNGE